MFNLVSIRNSGLFSSELLSSHHLAPQTVLVHGVITPCVQDFAFPMDKIKEIPVGSMLQPARVP